MTTPPAAAPVPAPAPSHAGESCGDLVLTRVGLIARGLGDQHPEVAGVDALLHDCSESDKKPSPESCKKVKQELTWARQSYGEGHPTIRGLRAKQSLCPK